MLQNKKGYRQLWLVSLRKIPPDYSKVLCRALCSVRSTRTPNKGAHEREIQFLADGRVDEANYFLIDANHKAFVWDVIFDVSARIFAILANVIN